jgi:uncharacterized protein YkwD
MIRRGVAQSKIKPTTKMNVKNTPEHKVVLLEDGHTEGVFFKVHSKASIVSDASSVADDTCDSSHSSASSRTSSSPASPPPSWKSTERQSFLLNQPLIVVDVEKEGIEANLDPATALGNVMLRSRKLPGADYYSSNHILVNEERVKRVIAPLHRLRELDELAREHAKVMARAQRLFHSNPTDLQAKFQRPFRQMGENVAAGRSIRDIHKYMMKNTACNTDKYNILHRRYTHMGMATAKGADGQLYLCQIFRG